MEKLGDKIFFLGGLLERTTRGYSVEANPKYIRDVITVLGLEDAKTSDDSECEEDANDRITR